MSPLGWIRNKADVFVFLYQTPAYSVDLSWFHNQEEKKYIDPLSTVRLDWKVFFPP